MVGMVFRLSVVMLVVAILVVISVLVAWAAIRVVERRGVNYKLR